jgi:heterotetrameric sarcosine oxidase gamma subunit
VADIPERRSPLAEIHQPGRFGSTRVDHPGVRLAHGGPMAMVHLSAVGDEADFRKRAREQAGIPLPTAAGTSSGAGPRVALWQAPGRWLVVSAADAPADLRDALAGLGGAAVDISHGWTTLRLGGPAAPAVLAKGCSLDLHEGRFPAGRCAQSEYRGLSIFLHAVDDSPRFDLYCQRSFARSLWEWLLDGAAEFGCEVT